MKAHINIVGAIPNRGTAVELDGVDITKGIRSLTLNAASGEVTQLILDVIILDGTVFDAEITQTRIPEHTHHALVALGWTPPAEAALDDDLLANDFADLLTGGLLDHPRVCDHCGLEMDTPVGHGVGVCVSTPGDASPTPPEAPAVDPASG